MVSKTLRKSLPILKYVARQKTSRRRQQILKELAFDPSIYKSLCEICLNTIKGSINLNKDDKAKLKRHKKCLVELASKKGDKNYKRKLVVQSGGAILPLLIPAAASIISALISQAKK